MDILFFLNSVLFGVALAMDAFSVSMANGLSEPNMKRKKMFGMASTFGVFQTAMPLIGWFCVKKLAEAFEVFNKFIPWIALALLIFLGVKMLCEAFSKKGEPEAIKLTFWALMVQGVATSIDALSVGFTIENLAFTEALTEALVIGIVTFAICVAGYYIGRKLGTRFSGKANIIGGVILILIGIEIFLKGIL